MLALCRCPQTWTVLREFVPPGWAYLQREMVRPVILAPAGKAVGSVAISMNDNPIDA